MAGINEDRERQVVPLWRNFRETNRRGELAAVAATGGNPFTDEMVAEVLEDWNDKPGLSTASDLVSVALTLGRFKLAADAAKFVIDHPAAPTPARGVASLYLAEGRPPPVSLGTAPTLFAEGGVAIPTILDQLCDGVRDVRQQLIAYPRNPILWSNLARLYTSLGEADKAARAIRAALALAPSNRFILRSAARFYLHQGQQDRSHRLLANASNVRSDPWVLSAEIATAASAGRTSQHIKLGKRLLEAQKLPPFHLSELASAIGTIESLSGNLKSGRKLIAFSLERPAENAIAQAAWLSRKMGGLYMPQAQSTASFEANAWNACQGARWDSALTEARQWLIDQPFSSRPAVFGAYLSSAILQDYTEAINFARHGLRSSPDDFSLHNNLAFALALHGKPDEAAKQLRQISQGRLTPEQQVTFAATRGLVAFRSGRPEAGRLYYRVAIERAHQLRDIRESVARIYFAMEELRIRSPNAEALRKEALDGAAGLPESQYQVLVDRLSKYRP